MLNISLSASQTFEIPLLRILCLVCNSFLIGLFELLVSNFLSYVFVLDTSSLSDIDLSHYFPVLNTCLKAFFALQKLFSFMGLIYQLLLLEPEPLVLCLGNFPLCQ